MKKLIDLRSDTVTQPTNEMREYMHSVPVGDDVYGEDPTVNLLEERTAAKLGFEAGLFCPSGTMTNQIAIKTHTIPGDEVICDHTAHIYNYEGGGMAFNSGVQVRAVQGDRGKISAAQVEEHIHPPVINLPRTSLVALENTLNKAGGGYYTLQEVAVISAMCRKHELPLHLDGARVFNALVATKESPAAYADYFDSISVCFSKGLGAPVGSVLVGSSGFIQKARRYRRLLGGGMRQAGAIAGGALYALEHHIDRLAEDHMHARLIGEVLQQCSFVKELVPVETNIIVFRLQDDLPAEHFLAALKEEGIIANTMGRQTIRLVTHLDVSSAQTEQVMAVLKKLAN